MKHSLKTGVAVLIVTFASACGAITDTDMPPGGLESVSLGTAESALSECLAVDQHKSFSAGVEGHKGNDTYPMNGRTVTRAKFDRSVDANCPFGIGGSGDAYIDKQDSTAVVVHYWYDYCTDLSYDLKVWVEC